MTSIGKIAPTPMERPPCPVWIIEFTDLPSQLFPVGLSTIALDFTQVFSVDVKVYRPRNTITATVYTNQTFENVREEINVATFPNNNDHVAIIKYLTDKLITPFAEYKKNAWRYEHFVKNA
jgi:hypothetical protein